MVFMKLGYDVGDQPEEALIMDVIVTLILSIVIFPLCIMKEFHKIRVIKLQLVWCILIKYVAFRL